MLAIVCAGTAAITMVSILHEGYAAGLQLLTHLHLQPAGLGLWSRVGAMAEVMLATGEAPLRQTVWACMLSACMLL